MTTFNASKTDRYIENPFKLNIRGHKGHRFKKGDELVYFQETYYSTYRIEITDIGQARLYLTGQMYTPGIFTKCDSFMGEYYPDRLDNLYLLVKEVQYDPTQQGDREDDI